jgi:1-phosphofructokinase family hexose kinase
VLIAGPNLTIDRTIRLAELRPGEVLRARSAVAGAGGKGVNVVRLAAALGCPAELVAFLPRGRSGEAVRAWLADSGVTLHAVAVPGEVRSAAIMLEDSGRATVLNEPGPPAGPEAWERLTASVEARMGGHRVLACSGSTPPDSPAGGYARLVAVAAAAGAISIVDTTGPALAAALEARPGLVTPNLAEAEELLTGRGDHGVESAAADVPARAAAAAAELVRRGARAAVVTAGAAGLALADGKSERWLPAPAVEPRNPIGAGDALVAGTGGALERGEPLEWAVPAGAAAAAASVECELPGRVEPDRAAALSAGLSWSPAA